MPQQMSTGFGWPALAKSLAVVILFHTLLYNTNTQKNARYAESKVWVLHPEA